MIPRSSPAPWLHRFAVLTALATLGLLGVGGLVTSHGVGMAVPDWPNTYGYNMFFFPPSRWVGGVFYEHTHRLLASGVGLLTTVLVVWLYGRKSRPVLRWGGVGLIVLGSATFVATRSRWADAAVLAITGLAGLATSYVWPKSEPCAKWLRRMGLLALLAVALQGVLGGLRVVLFKDEIGIFHAALAQSFFVLVCVLAAVTSPRWQQLSTASTGPMSSPVPRASQLFFLAGTLLIFWQLVLGATMRHQHAGLAIPDFPSAYGHLWPDTSPQAIALYNARRLEVIAVKPITAVQIWFQMAHRGMALLILAAAVGSAWVTWRRLPPGHVLRKLGTVWLGLILVQVLLGAWTIWSGKAADIATAHVVVGALCLAGGALGTILSLRTSSFAGAMTSPAGYPALPLATASAAEPGHL